jgi:ribosomal protein S18 acetylase RimI-like enzyme
VTENRPFRLEVLTDHDRTGFECSSAELTQYFRTGVSQDVRRRVTNCFVAVQTTTGLLAGFYTLAATGIPLTELPESVTKKLPRYPLVPAVLIGRLAVDTRFANQGLGGALLADAIDRCIQSPPAAFAVLVDAKDDNAVSFYGHHGFIKMTDPQKLFLPLATAEKALRAGK